MIALLEAVLSLWFFFTAIVYRAAGHDWTFEAWLCSILSFWWFTSKVYERWRDDE